MKKKLKYISISVTILAMILVLYYKSSHIIKEKDSVIEIFRNLCAMDNKELVQKINTNPEVFKLKDKYGSDYLDFCITHNMFDHFKCLIENNFQFRYKQQHYLNRTIFLKRKKMTQTLLKNGVKKTIAYEISVDNLQALKQWIANKEKNNLSYSQSNIYALALKYKSMKCLKFILTGIKKKTESFFLFRKAIVEENVEVLKLLCQEGFDINSTSWYDKNNNVLNCAYSYGANDKIISCLKELGAVENKATKEYKNKYKKDRNRSKIIENFSEVN
ncbi:hypothetical protein AAEX28_06720 [Lentisphaerota bacterium WC36G]|nr:hypothetical protein LJT99_09585 [Lentisphaerae bacterium WC36]